MSFSKKLYAAAIALSMLAPSAEAQSSLELIATRQQETSRARPHLHYDIPGGRGYTFIELYGDGENYYARTMARFDVADDTRVRVDVLNNSRGQDTGAIGMEYVVGNGDVNGRVGFQPVWVSKEGLEEKITANAAFKVAPSENFKVTAFGEVDVRAKQWTYGELGVEYDIADPLAVGVGMDMRNDGDLAPSLNPRVSIRFTPE